MDSETITNKVLAKIDTLTMQVIAAELQDELTEAIVNLNDKLRSTKTPLDRLSPPPELIFEAFRACPITRVRVVILGQDPYINVGQATGMSFSVPDKFSIPPSLLMIYKCLLRAGLISSMPNTGNLRNWTTQGVLLLNCALTTVLSKSAAHTSVWERYTDALLKKIAMLDRSVIFMLFGAYAQRYAEMLDVDKTPRNVILQWGHPSPLNQANRSDNPRSFIYCDAFERANNILTERGEKPIEWDPRVNIEAPEPVCWNVPASQMYVFTDGAARGNGKAHCRSSWAFCVATTDALVTRSGLVDPVLIPGKVYKTSNQRAELTAVLRALEYIRERLACAHKREFLQVKMFVDNEYAIKVLTKWAPKWFADPVNHAEKSNLDLAKIAYEVYTDLKCKIQITMTHIYSHQKEPAVGTYEWFCWRHNDIADKLATAELEK
jgi:uracil-DNA glycosylase